MYRSVFKPILFRFFSAEKAHHLAFFSLKILKYLFFLKPILKYYFSISNQKKINVAGISFPNQVGLAAGFDKNAEAIDELALLGFGFIEIGTVTPKPQAGNPSPRLFRLPKDLAIINRMGFNNDGLEKIIQRLKKRKSKVVVGGNIGKNKDTPNEKAIDDYLICLKGLYEYVDYFTVNVSSPNTPNLRQLQEKEPLLALLKTLQNEVKNQVNNQKKSKPIFLKIAPDLTQTQLEEIVEVVIESNLAGIIATNTTIQRTDLLTSMSEIEAIGAGGLSGLPVRERATQVIDFLKQKSQNKFAIIGVGGIFSGEDAQQKLNAGADLVQVYTGLIYQGPNLVKNILKKIR
ncbi:MAG: quinone-dependent dihydroorotate dehydrogenase [Bacteroidetes bacterium]|nr:MAG: quinone-dependent dihydroorotate dehydrogenase [Bacteroidota bacterium]TAG92989.1 MAG: quinone-dependent dihydroorotate dehydrogenase [Bacteroidota bacterium]